MPVTRDLLRVREILESEREWAAFALADLASEHHPFTEWHVQDDRLLLVYRGYTPPLLFAMDNSGPLLEEIAAEPELFVAVRYPLVDPICAQGWELRERKKMHRLVLRGAIVGADHGEAVQLGPEDCGHLLRLFADGDASGERPAFFQPAALTNGIYFGVREGGELVAAGGTLVSASAESVACIGNVYTRRDRRGRGLASAVAAAIASELRRRGVRTIVLNVRADNHAAIRVYERLGFSHCCDYWEARAVRGVSAI
ncbi:MAG TPA: GNAT family N-acetyltransferase [Bryobacteraceae bacterium]|jgi:GNAT superfamily N-acetyltransferase